MAIFPFLKQVATHSWLSKLTPGWVNSLFRVMPHVSLYSHLVDTWDTSVD